jgi:hypothetical protein
LSMDSAWRGFLRRHWMAVAIFVPAAVLAFLWSIYVFLWFVGNAESSRMVPGILGLWTMANLVTFIIYAVLWELLLVGVPVAIGAVAGWRWWRGLPAEEKTGYRFGGKRSTGGGGGLSLLFFIAFCIKVYIDGKWNVPVALWTLDYVVDSAVTILVWGLVIFGIPAAIALTWWLRREMKKP